MKNLNMKPFIYMLAVLSALVLYITALIKEVDPTNFLDLIGIIPIIVTVDFIAYLTFTTWLWRFEFLQGWLIPFPDLNGTWEGQIHSSYKDEDNKKSGPLPVILTIRQKFGRLSCVMRTKEMTSHSYLEGFIINKEEQVQQLCYSYASRPKAELRDKSTPHDGTALFNIIGKPVEKLIGEYWTLRNTRGTFTLKFREKKILEEFPISLVKSISGQDSAD